MDRNSVGKTVFTVRADTNDIDTWTLDGILEIPNDRKAILRSGVRTCILPVGCVFETREKALEVANKKFFN